MRKITFSKLKLRIELNNMEIVSQPSAFQSTYLYICVPLILYSCVNARLRDCLKLCMWSRPMGVGDIGHVRPASVASEAVS